MCLSVVPLTDDIRPPIINDVVNLSFNRPDLRGCYSCTDDILGVEPEKGQYNSRLSNPSPEMTSISGIGADKDPSS
jgi:hypothetical protein